MIFFKSHMDFQKFLKWETTKKKWINVGLPQKGKELVGIDHVRLAGWLTPYKRHAFR